MLFTRIAVQSVEESAYSIDQKLLLSHFDLGYSMCETDDSNVLMEIFFHINMRP